VLKWPDLAAVEQALRRWVGEALGARDDIVQIGYFGSYARGDWGVGSDLDLVIIIEDSDVPFERRSPPWDTTPLPVPADVLVYTAREWDRLRSESPFCRALARETKWLYPWEQERQCTAGAV